MAKYKIILEVEVTKDSQGEAPISSQEIENYIKKEVEQNEDLKIIKSYARDIE